MGIFGDIGKANVYGTSKPLAHGKHVVRVKQCISKRGDGKIKTDWWIVEAEVVESESHSIGDVRSWVVNLGQSAGPGNVKGMLLAAARCANPTLTLDGMSPAEWEKFAEKAADPAVQALRGLLLTVEVFPIKTSEGKDFSKHVWTAIASTGAHVPNVQEDAPPAPPEPPAPAAVEVPAALAAAVAPYLKARQTPDQIREALSKWATGRGFSAAQLDAAIAA